MLLFIGHPDKHFTIDGFRIVAKRANNGCFIKAFGLDNPKVDPFIENLLCHIPLTNDETTFKRFLETAITGYKNSILG